jgi:hypothetical protein
MANINPLQLKPLPSIVAAYILAPLAGLTALWVVWIVPSSPWPSALTSWGFIIVIGGAVCLTVEMVVVTPLLLAFRRYRWPWLNGWTAAVLAFLVGAICSLIWAVYDAGRSIPGYSEWGQNGVAFFLNGVRTQAGWQVWRAQLFSSAVACGGVGVIAALVFRLVAIRSERASDVGHQVVR